jgi:hypothetical protein
MIAPTMDTGPTLWIRPQAPGRSPANTDGTAAQISAARHVWDEDVQTYRTYTSVQQDLKKQIISVFEPMYLDILNDNMVGNNKSMFETCRTPPLLKSHETAIVDSGCTGHFLLVNAPCLNKIKSQTPLTVRLPNVATMESSHTADLDIPELNAAASKAHVFPGMANHSLLSV